MAEKSSGGEGESGRVLLAWWTPKRIAWGLGIVAFLAVLLTLGDPGITIDEPLDVRPGRTYVATLWAKGLKFFDRATIDAVFRDNAEHPPLGRWLLGIASTLGEPIEQIWKGSRDPTGLYIVSGRLAPALAFAAMVGLVSSTAGSRFGRVAGIAAGFGLAVMPRVFAHAHFGALDTFIAFFWTSALLTAVRATESRRPVVSMALAGLAFGLALLTKIHAWFLPPIVLIWALTRLKPARAIASMAAWTSVGLATFFVGWPWLWHDPVGRLRAYLGTGVDRVSIQVLYFGQVYADRDVPWHYPWLYFAATVPIGLLVLGAWGMARGWAGRRVDASPLLLAGSIAFFLVLFSTGVPVYDGERLFLMAFPMFSILVGLGFADLWRRAGRKGRLALAVVLLGQGYEVVAFHPFGLSYYNATVGGLAGAEKLGLELTYWGDAVDGELLDALAHFVNEGDTVALVPTLAPDQGKVITTRKLLAKKVIIADQDQVRRADWLVVSRRAAYWPPDLIPRLQRDPYLVRTARQGVWLSEIRVRRKSGFP